MKRLSLYRIAIGFLVTASFTGCYKLQKDYDYKPFTLDPKINMTAKEFLLSRGTNGTGSDTVFKWMQMGIEYAGIDLAEYEKPGRTYIFLHNNAVRTITSGKISAGFFFDYPIVARDVAGNIIKSKINPALDSLRIATSWTDYPKELVKNYFLYLILQGEYSFENLSVNNTSIQTLLPAGTTADPGESKLGYVITKTSPNPDPASASQITFDPATGTGFDPEGKMNLKLVNSQNAPINLNDRADDRTAGYFADNGKIHVYDRTIHPFRYSYP